MEYRIILVIGVIFIMAAICIRNGFVHEKERRKGYKRTNALVNRVIYSDSGNVKYYVSYEKDEKKILAQTDHYSSSTKNLNPGDAVEIGYYYTKSGNPRAVIFDNRIIPVYAELRKTYVIAGVIGICFLTIGICAMIF